MGNTFGTLFRVTTFGESHGAAIGAVVDGCPARLKLNERDIQLELDRRRPGQSSVSTQRKEGDKVKILSGVFEDMTLGSPIAMIIENEDHRSSDYAELKSVYRPGHADYSWDAKYGFRDHRGGGRASGRETAGRVMAGAVAKKLLSTTGSRFGLKKAIKVFAYAKQVAGIVGDKVDLAYIEKNPVRAADPKAAKKMEEAILNAAREGDSVGGVVEIIVKNMPVGLGEPVFDKLSADISKALFSIQTVKAVEIGSGYAAGAMRGSEHNDVLLNQRSFEPPEWKTANNHGGGISGGISTGEDLIFRVTVKPPSSIAKTQETVTSKGLRQKLSVKGRHDPCIIPRFIPVAEAMVAITLADHVLRYRAIK